MLAIILNGIALHRTWVYAKTFSFLEIVGNNPFKPELGVQQSLPKQVIDSKFLIDKHKLNEVSIGEYFQKNGLLHQRATEFFFPTKINTKQTDYVIELIPHEITACQIIEQYKTVTLYACK